MEKKFRITVDGREYTVTVEDLTEGTGSLYPAPGSMTIPASAAAPGPTAATAAAPRAQSGPGDVVATLGGVVESIPVSVGQQVGPGDKVVVIEAMKMKNNMVASRAGKVASIVVKVGDAVEPGQVLLTIS
jgi:glutaconyl-CoA/methylmalonyl-CoA decarboxylase subunit gamma